MPNNPSSRVFPTGHVVRAPADSAGGPGGSEGGVPDPAVPRLQDLPRGSGERILLVDDEETVRRVTARLLEHLGYEVQMVGDPLLVMDLLESADFDLVLTDVVMPGMTGIELAKNIRADRPQQAILFTSGYTPKVYGGGRAEPLMPKPYSMAELANAVMTALEGSGDA